jgi:hypothetical protein
MEIEMSEMTLEQVRNKIALSNYPEKYDWMRAIDAALQSRAQGEAVAWPERMVNMPAGDSSEDRIIGFLVKDNDPILGEYGLSEPLAWLRKVTVDRFTTPPAAVAKDAYAAGYARGHDDTVESRYVDPQVAAQEYDAALHTPAEPSIPVSKVREIVRRLRDYAEQYAANGTTSSWADDLDRILAEYAGGWK